MTASYFVTRALHLTVGFAMASAIYGQQTAANIRGGAGVQHVVKPPSDHKPMNPADLSLFYVERVLHSKDPTHRIGSTQLHRMGDFAGMALVKLVGTKPLTTTEIQTLLDIVHRAFELPQAIVRASNRDPGATLFLLSYLELTTQDEGIKSSIANEREYVTAQCRLVSSPALQ